MRDPAGARRFKRKSQVAAERSAESAHALRSAGDRHADRSVVRPVRGGMRELRFERGVIPSKRRCCVSERGRKHCAAADAAASAAFDRDGTRGHSQAQRSGVHRGHAGGAPPSALTGAHRKLIADLSAPSPTNTALTPSLLSRLLAHDRVLLEDYTKLRLSGCSDPLRAQMRRVMRAR